MSKKKMTKKKKIILCIIAILLIALIIFKVVVPSKKEEEPMEFEAIQKRDIAQSISATGIISTNDTKNVTATLTGSEIKTVNVKEGQRIEVGDVICTFDTSTLQKNLNIAQASQNTTKAQANIGVQSAQRNLNDAIDNRNKQSDSTQDAVNTAKNAYDGAVNQLETVNIALNQKQTELNTYVATNGAVIQAYQEAKTKCDELETELNNKKNEIDRLEYVLQQSTSESGTPEYNAILTQQNNLKAELPTLQNNYNIEKSKVDASIIAKNGCDNLTKERDALATQKATLEASVNNLKVAYENAQTAHDSTVKAADSTIAGLRDNLANSELSVISSSLAQESQINTLREQIADGVVKSTVSGTVTKVNVKQGDLYTGSAIAVIEGCEEFIVESQVDEYDIADVEVGMKVFIKTDATRDEELEGRVIYVAPSATNNQVAGMSQMSASTTGSSATYTVKIELDTPNDRLRLGMNAKLSIVTNSRENVWSVPYEAVYDREDGTSYIEILKNEETQEKEELDVKRGLEGTYYVEIISDKLKEGMNVVLPKIEAGNSLENLLEAMGAEAGL